MNNSMLTLREKEVFDYIVDQMNETQTSPTMREIAEGVNLGSVSSVHRYVHSLISKGRLFAFKTRTGQLQAIIPVTEET